MQNEIRKGIDRENWEILSTILPENKGCLLCPSIELPNVEKKVKEIDALKDKKGFWIVRAIVDPYPITHPSSFKLTSDNELKKTFNAHGWSEIIIETRNHAKEFHELSVDDIKNVLILYKKRIKNLKEKEGVEYIGIVKDNMNEEFEHSYSKIFTLPIVPNKIKEKLQKFKEYKLKNEKCLYCELIKNANSSTVVENEYFIAIVPFVIEVPYHIQIFPKKHIANFEDLSEVELFSLAEIIKNVLIRLKAAIDPFKYFISFVIKPPKEDDFHFHIELGQKYFNSTLFESYGINFFRFTPEDYAKILRGKNGR